MNDKLDDEQVRALLRSVRSDEPMPSDVASRLDDVLAGLASSPAAPESVAPVIPLRRRLAPKLLAAAAAVVLVAGVGVGLSQIQSDQGESSDAAGGQALESGDAEEPAASGPGAEQDGETGAETYDARVLSRAQGPELREAARALVEGRSTPRSGSPTQQRPPAPEETDDPFAPDDATATLADCPTPSLAEETGALREVVLLAAVPALLVVGPVEDGVRPVQLWSCETDLLLATDRLPVDAAR